LFDPVRLVDAAESSAAPHHRRAGTCSRGSRQTDNLAESPDVWWGPIDSLRPVPERAKPALPHW
jgi:hypothetical protein